MQAELTNTSNKTYFKVEFSGKTQTVSVQKLFHKLKAPFLGNWEKLIKLKATYHSINTSHIIFGTLPTKIFVFTSICLEFGSSKCWYLLTLEKTTGCQTWSFLLAPDFFLLSRNSFLLNPWVCFFSFWTFSHEFWVFF